MHGLLAQGMLARSIREHPRKDGRSWAIRVVTLTNPGDLISQPQYSYADTAFDPIVEVITEEEAPYLGVANIRAGDLRLTIEGQLTITTETKLVCDGQEVDVLKSDPVWHGGLVQQHKVYVHRRPEV